jgi:demethoxyubiquinone hydroxylase (CLK1/Coq7/Cat5 family)
MATNDRPFLSNTLWYIVQLALGIILALVSAWAVEMNTRVGKIEADLMQSKIDRATLNTKMDQVLKQQGRANDTLDQLRKELLDHSARTR